MNASKLVKKQVKAFRKELANGDVFIVQVRHDDDCGNGHNTFTITSDLYTLPYRRNEESVENSKGKLRSLSCCGCMHDEVVKHFPRLAHLLKWHLCSTDGPMHYIANTVYHAQQGKLDFARSSAVWPDATLEQLQDEKALASRLPAMMEEFRRDVESLGLVY